MEILFSTVDIQGRPEIWQAIRSALEETDMSQIQAILDASHLIVPSDRSVEMTMTHIPGFDPRSQFTCYDQLGNRYVVPLKYIAAPSNIVEDVPLLATTAPLAGAASIIRDETGSGKVPAHDGLDSHGIGEGCSRSVSSKVQQAWDGLSDGHGRTLHSAQITSTVDEESTNKSPTCHPNIVRVRLSATQKEHHLSIAAPVITVRSVRQALVKHLVDAGIEPGKHRLRIFFLGRELADNDELAHVRHFTMGVDGTMLQAQVIPLA
ncbi:hypothetical protein BGW42_004653 [Actinomortierella wolfii]|nr:hypothetical protein BGW42_004653 [Actinomortierella wolfii]